MAEGCDGCDALFEGIPKGCENNIGGIKKMYITEKCNVTALALSSPGDEISAITMAALTVFYEFVFNKNTSTFKETTNFDSANGNDLTTQTITLKLARREKSKRDTLLLIGMQKDLVVIITDSNDINWYFGEANGVNMTTNDSDTGTTKKDFNGYVITLLGEEPEPANTVTDAALAAVI